MNDSYKHPNWQRKRLEILSRDDFTCVACGDKESTLHVHHMLYPAGEVWEIDDKFLQTLCEDCHDFLGSHPKGGVYWYKQERDIPSVVVCCWCPSCGSYEFQDKGTYVKCRSCKWRSDIYCDKGVIYGQNVVFEIEQVTPKKPQTYSVDWIKGIGTKARKGGATDQQLFDAMFPDKIVGELFDELRSRTKSLREGLSAGDMTEEQEANCILDVVRARRSLAAAMAEMNATQ